jgi:CRP-like cAMP-binding protein
LGQLPARELEAIEAKLTTISLKQKTVLHPPDEPINRIYFPLSGMISLLSITSQGDAIETGIVGSDGIVGGSCAIDGGLHQDIAAWLPELSRDILKKLPRSLDNHNNGFGQWLYQSDGHDTAR